MLLSNSPLKKSCIKIHTASNYAETYLIPHTLTVLYFSFLPICVRKDVPLLKFAWIHHLIWSSLHMFIYWLLISSEMICLFMSLPICFWNFVFLVLISKDFYKLRIGTLCLSHMLQIIPKAMLMKQTKNNSKWVRSLFSNLET